MAANMIHWRVAPDGSRTTIRRPDGHRRWEVKYDRGGDLCASRRLALTLAAATVGVCLHPRIATDLFRFEYRCFRERADAP